MEGRKIETGIVAAAAVSLTLYHLYEWWKRKSANASGEPIALHPLEKTVPPKVNELLSEVKYRELLLLLYVIAEDQENSTGYIFRGVTCNCCGMSPIKSTRYRCSECVDVDLCPKCEAAGRHDPKHILLKIKVPIPMMSSPRWVRQSALPPETQAAPPIPTLTALPDEVAVGIGAKVSFSRMQLEIALQRFSMYADTILGSDVSKVPYGISRQAFSQAVVPRDPESLIALVAANMYDQDDDGVIRFEEFANVLDIILDNSERGSCAKQLLAFKAFDLDNTGVMKMSNVEKVLLSYYNSEKDYVPQYPVEDIAQASDFRGFDSGLRPLSSYFDSDLAPGAIYPAKDLKLQAAPGVLDYIEDKFAPLHFPVGGRSRHARKFGAQANKELDDHTRIALMQYLTAVWAAYEWPDELVYGEESLKPFTRYSFLCYWMHLCVL